MKPNSSITIMAALTLMALGAVACRHYDEQPELNKGYDRNVMLPEPDSLTHADSILLDSIRAEYERNAR